jgi:hypothetical protein
MLPCSITRYSTLMRSHIFLRTSTLQPFAHSLAYALLYLHFTTVETQHRLYPLSHSAYNVPALSLSNSANSADVVILVLASC